jgi:glutamine amidotransferase
MKVGVIDYGVGNLRSVGRALEAVGASPIRVSKPEEGVNLDRLVLPGVGSFGDCAQILREDGWFDMLRDHVFREKPLLGICLGMQLLATSSTEGATSASTVEGLGIIPGRVVELSQVGCSLRLPHVGWNEILVTHSESPLLVSVPNGTDFYYVHRYTFVPDDKAHIIATTEYGVSFVSMVGKGSVYGTQFHPEKSSRAGLQVLRNFIGCQQC